jgi:ankyrin repeat protein
VSRQRNGSDEVETEKTHKAVPPSKTHHLSMNTLLAAAAAGDADAVTRLLDGGASVTDTDKHERTALHLAASSGHVAVIQLLLGREADVDAEDEHERTALHLAAAGGHEGAVRALLSASDADAEDEDANTPAYLALVNGHSEVAKLVVEEGEAELDAACEAGQTLLHLACGQNDVATATWLLEHGASCAIKDRFRNTALHAAAEHGSWDAALLLLEKGADASAAGKDANTALHLVAANPSEAKKRIPLVDVLLDKALATAKALNTQHCRPSQLIPGNSAEDTELRDMLLVRPAASTCQHAVSHSTDSSCIHPHPTGG